MLQAILGSGGSCTSLLFGDNNAESALIDEICDEINEGRPTTCILYPTPTALSLGDWIRSRPPASSQQPAAGAKYQQPAAGGAAVRVVVLDGTYNQANRQWKYLTKALAQRYREGRVVSAALPVVKLDLEEGKCKSAIAGIMSQPGKEKICSYQGEFVVAVHV